MAFTEQGVAMLSSALRSRRAVQVNVAVMRAFVRLDASLWNLNFGGWNSDRKGMTRDEFEALVKSLEAARIRRPKVFVWNTVLLVLGAYGYLLATFVISLGLLALFVALLLLKPNAATFKIGICAIVVFGGIALAIVKGLWVRLEPPQGVRLKPEDAPALFSMLEELRQKLDSAPFHEVLLVPEHNAAVVQVPRLGIFGWHKNYLLIGLPLLQGLAPEEFKAVLAHEFAHSSRGHGRFGNWLYRLRRSWERIVHEMAQQENSGTIVLTAFLKFFWPRFNGRAFVLSRANEYEADDTAKRLTSARDAANALLRVSLNDRFLDEKFWPALYERANTEAVPPPDVFGTAAAGLRFTAREQESGKWVQQAFLLETNSADTHPSLKDRLRALGVGELTAEDLPELEESAGEVFIGGQFAALTEQISAKWREQVEAIWKNRHQEAGRIATELQALEGAERTEDVEVLWKKAEALLNLKGDEAAAELIDKIIEIAPGDARALFVKGRRLLEKDDASGIELVERAMQADAFLTEAGCQLLYGYYTRAGERDKLRTIEDRIEAFQNLQVEAQQERMNVTEADTLLPAQLTEEQLQQVREVFATDRAIAAVAIARKQVKIFPESPAFVVSLKIKIPFLSVRADTSHEKIVNWVIEKLRLPGFMVVVVADSKAGKKLFAVEGSEIYRRGN